MPEGDVRGVWMGSVSSRLIGQIYQAATDVDGADVLASALADAFESESCLMYFRRMASAAMPTLSGVLSGTENFTEQNLSAYVDYYHELDIWYERGWRKGIPAIVLGQELIDTTELLRTEWSDYLQATETQHVLGVQYHIAGDALGLIGIHRAPGRDVFDEHDRKRMAMLLPHLQRAMQIRERLALSGHRGALSLELLDRLTVAVALTTADGRVLFANRTADRLLQKRHALTVRQGCLHPCHAGDRRAFAKLLAEAAQAGGDAGTGSGGMFCLTMPLGRKLPVLLAPMRSACIGMESLQSVAAVIFSGAGSESRGSEAYLSRRYGLTPAEARLLSALIAGRGLVEYADDAGIGIGTARTYLKSLFAKTGCHRQVDLVRTVLADPLIKLVS